MNLPTQSQVNAATRNIASAAGGAILMFGLATKVDPDTINSIIAATGTLVNDAIVLIGLVGPIIASWYASHSATPVAQAVSLEKQGAIVVASPEIAAATPNSPNVLSSLEVKVVPK